MLGDTDKHPRRNKGSKLPKLTIQQQIDNQQVIERMNRKVAFTKNPRHLIKTMAMVTALATPSSSNLILTPIPSSLHFSNYLPNHTYECTLRLLNATPHIQRCKVIPLRNPCFVISSVQYPRQDSGDIAPGMSMVLSIRFRPTTLDDYHEQLTVVVAEGVLRVPLSAEREKCRVEWPSVVDCGHCWVGSTIHKSIPLTNHQGQATFTLLPSSIFAVSPPQLHFHKHSTQYVVVGFTPHVEGNYEETIVYVSEQEQRNQIRIRAGAYRAQVVVESMNKERVVQHKVNHVLHLKQSQINQCSVNSIELRNLAVVEVQYFWVIDQGCRMSDSRGVLPPSGVKSFSLQVQNNKVHPTLLTAELYLYNLPQESLVTNSITKIIDGIPSILCLTLSLDSYVMGSPWSVFPSYLQITAPLYKGNEVQQYITISNKSSLQRVFNIIPIEGSSLLSVQCVTPSLTVAPNAVVQVQMKCRMTQLSRQLQMVSFIVECANNDSEIIRLGGVATYPDVKVDPTIYYGLLRVNCVQKVMLPITNEQGAAVRICIHNPNRFRQLQFYSFYEFQDDQAKDKLLMVYTDVGQAVGWLTVQPHSTMELVCVYYAKEEQSVDLHLQLQVEDGGRYELAVVGQVRDVGVSLSRQQINLKEIYKGNVYNSNKFLSKQLSMRNMSPLVTGFELRVMEEGECLVRVSPMAGQLGCGADQRIDIVIEPIRTGEFEIALEWRCFDPVQVKAQPWDSGRRALHSLYKYGQMKIRGCVKGLQINYYMKDESRVRRVRQKVEEAAQSVKASSFKSNRNETDKLIYPQLQMLGYYNCQINSVRQLQIIIENDSGLSAEYRVCAERYASEVSAVEQRKMTGTKTTSASRLIMKEEKAFHSVMGEEYAQQKQLKQSQKAQLVSGQGIAIHCDPSAGVLHKKQRQRVVVTVFNDCSGLFRDTLLIDVVCVITQIKDHQVKRVPIDIHVVGTPVVLARNQLGIDFAQAVPLMQLNTLLPRNGCFRRQLKVVNNGSNSIQLKWSVYPCPARDPTQDIFNIGLKESPPGSTDLVQISYEAIRPKVEEDTMFAVQPMQMVLGGREEGVFTLQVRELLAVGSLRNVFVCEPRTVEENRKLDVLAVVVQADVVDPYLALEHTNTLQRFAVEHAQPQTNSNNHRRKIVLKNELRVNLPLTIDVRGPFTIVSTSAQSQLEVQKLTSRKPQRSYVLNHEHVLEVTVELGKEDWGMEERVRKEGVLQIQFCNGSKQEVNLVGWLYRPYPILLLPDNQPWSPAHSIVDLGVVHVKNTKRVELTLTNPSAVDAHFTITYLKYMLSMKYKFEESLWTEQDREDQNIVDKKECFKLNVEKGVVRAHTLPVHYIPPTAALYSLDDHFAQTHHSVSIVFLFLPDSDALFKSKFRISILEGPSLDIIFKGRGTFAEEAYIK